MNELLLERSTGNLGPNAFARLQTTQLLRSFRPAPHFRFDGGETGLGGGASPSDDDSSAVSLWAHQAGVNALALERFDGRILVSGGSDATIRIWDLEQNPNAHQPHTYRPVAHIARAEAPPAPTSAARGASRRPPAAAAAAAPPSTHGAHRFGITHLSFYPFDSAAFLSSSYDQTLKLWSTHTAQLSGSFGLGSKVYTHAASPIASHLLVACGTQHPAVRLVDLRSGAAVQSLVAPGQVGGSAGAVLAVAWSPRHEHVLASGTTDGAVRIWDVRRASGLVGLLDQEDSLGISVRGRSGAAAATATTGFAELQQRGIRMSARAHTGPVNGLTWTDDGAFIVSAGLDQRIRVWDAATGANTLASFGPTIRNRAIGTAHGMFVTPTGLTPPRSELLAWPNENEILLLDLHRGSVVSRLRGVGPTVAAVQSRGGAGERTVRNRVTSMVWRGAGGGGGSSGVVMGGTGAPGGIYSGHLDGQIRAWVPAVEGDDAEDEDTSAQDLVEEKTKKRKAIDDAFRSLMGRQVTFT